MPASMSTRPAGAEAEVAAGGAAAAAAAGAAGAAADHPTTARTGGSGLRPPGRQGSGGGARTTVSTGAENGAGAPRRRPGTAGAASRSGLRLTILRHATLLLRGGPRWPGGAGGTLPGLWVLGAAAAVGGRWNTLDRLPEIRWTGACRRMEGNTSMVSKGPRGCRGVRCVCVCARARFLVQRLPR